MRHLLIAGNWKMNKDRNETLNFVQGLRDYAFRQDVSGMGIIIAPPYPFLQLAGETLQGTGIRVAAQDVSAKADGAFTGEVSASMLASLKLPYCIAGHSERRHYHGETDALVNTKLQRLLAEHITPIFCLGERLEERETGQTFEVLERQLTVGLQDISLQNGMEIVIAYEPVWAIGTGKVATPAQAQEAHAFLRNRIEKLYGKGVSGNLLIQYGGSVKPDNIGELMQQTDIDGALIGGASLQLDQFIAMLETAKQVSKNKK